MSQIPENWDLPDTLSLRVRGHLSRQRAIVESGHLILFLHDVPNAGDEERDGVFFYRNPEGVWQNSANNTGLDELMVMVERYEDRIDTIEAKLSTPGGARVCFEVLRELAPVLRALRNLSGALVSAREQAPRHSHELIEATEESHTQERASELLFSDARNALDYSLAQETERHTQVNLELARAAHRLNLMVALFLPLTAIASLFGMNLISGLEAYPPWLFWTIFGGGVTIGLIVRYFINYAKIPVVEKISTKKLVPFLPIPGKTGSHLEENKAE